MLCGDVGYHDYAIDDEMDERIINDLGPERKILILRNHGLAVCGSSVEEAWFYLFEFMVAASIQSHALASAGGHVDKLIIPPARVRNQVRRFVNSGDVVSDTDDDIKYQVGEMEFEAEMRVLDRMVRFLICQTIHFVSNDFDKKGL